MAQGGFRQSAGWNYINFKLLSVRGNETAVPYYSLVLMPSKPGLTRREAALSYENHRRAVSKLWAAFYR